MTEFMMTVVYFTGIDFWLYNKMTFPEKEKIKTATWERQFDYRQSYYSNIPLL